MKSNSEFRDSILKKATGISANANKRKSESPEDTQSPQKKARIDSEPITETVESNEAGRSGATLPKPQGRACGLKHAAEKLESCLKRPNPDDEKKKPQSDNEPKKNPPGTEEGLPKARDNSSESTSKQKRKKRGITGLVNFYELCFANSVLQFIDAALDDINLDATLGALEKRQLLGESDIKLMDKSRPPPRAPPRSKRRLQTLVRNIHNLISESENAKDRSLRRHLRKLLDRMRRHGDEKEPYLSGMHFQQMLAYGHPDSDPDERREEMDGRSQQDCHEYFGEVLNCVINEKSNVDDTNKDIGGQVLENAFSFTTESRTVCRTSGCKFSRGAATTEHCKTQGVHLTDSKTPKSLCDLLNASTRSQLDMECSDCGEMLERKSTIKEVGDNFVVHVNRTDKRKNQKIKTPVKLAKILTIGGIMFSLSAVIKHKGDYADHGHYSMFRRREREYVTQPYTNSLWYHIDDHKITAVPTEKVLMDGGLGGECAMLLFKII